MFLRFYLKAAKSRSKSDFSFALRENQLLEKSCLLDEVGHRTHRRNWDRRNWDDVGHRRQKNGRPPTAAFLPTAMFYYCGSYYVQIVYTKLLKSTGDVGRTIQLETLC